MTSNTYCSFFRYPAEKISILTTYNGQRDLINDVLNQRCSWNPLFGTPGSVSTVDRYQGQQNDYILLSLVRTKTVGHLRDVRRLIVSLSRARLGLYVFCRVKLFEECVELQPALQRLLDGRPAGKLWIKCGPSERFDENFSRKLPAAASSSAVLAAVDAPKEDVGNDKKKGRQSKSPDRKGKKTGEEETTALPAKSLNVVLGEEGVFAIEGVEHFGSYVHQMTTEQIQWLKKQRDERRKQESQ
jgi:intron-binding protein aquarius